MADAVTLDPQGRQGLLDVLGNMGFTVLGPTVRKGAVVPVQFPARELIWEGCRTTDSLTVEGE